MKFLLHIFALLTCVRIAAQDTCRFTLRFPPDEYALSHAQVTSLDSLMTELDEDLHASLYYIQGHADSTGDPEYNLRLSEKRSRSLKKFLLKKGVRENSIFVEKFGAEMPVASNETESGRADNRRTHLTIVTRIPPPDWKIKPQIHPANTHVKTIITTRNGCKVTVPAGAFELPDNFPPGDKIEIEITEYNNAAYFIASGIPMSYSASGRLFMYHSEEMIGIRAHYRSQPVNLRDSVRLTLNCRTVDSLSCTGFYKFNLKEHKWFEEEIPRNAAKNQDKKISGDDKPPASAKQETITIEIPQKKEDDKIPELRLDTGWIAKARIDTGGVKAKKEKNEEQFDSLAYVCTPNCCHAPLYINLGRKLSEKKIDLSGLDLSFSTMSIRTADLSYVEPEAEQTEERMGSKKFYHIRVTAKKRLLLRSAIVKFIFDKNLNPELKALRKIKWIYRFRDNEESHMLFKRRSFSDIRVVFDPETGKASVKLHGKDSVYAITLVPKASRRQITERMSHYKKIITPRIMSVYSCLWVFHKKFVDRSESKRSFSSWVDNYNANLHKVHALYDSLHRNVDKFIAGLHCDCPTPPCFDCIPCDSCVPPDSIRKKLLRRSGPDRILIIGLGLYNFDNVVPLDDVIRLRSPVFTDTRGKRIRVKQAFLLLNGINGMIHQPGPYMLIAKYTNTLFIVAQSNRRYKIILPKTEDLRRHRGTFVLEDITARTQTLEGLEKELLSK